MLGNVFLDRGDGGRAAATYEEGLRLANTAEVSAQYFVSLSRAYLAAKQTGAAVEAARRALATVGDVYELHQALGNALRLHGQSAAAAEELRTAVAQKPDSASAHYGLALALLDLRQLEAAVEALHRSQQANPSFPPTLALLAQIEIDSGRWQRAMRYLQPLYDAQPDLPEARQKMAFLHLRAGAEAEREEDLAAALRHYQTGAAIAPDHAELHARFGVLLLRQGRFAEAVSPLEVFHRLQPDGGQSALFLGQAYAMSGRRDDARRLLQRAAELAIQAGNSALAQRSREMLDQLQ